MYSSSMLFLHAYSYVIHLIDASWIPCNWVHPHLPQRERSSIDYTLCQFQIHCSGAHTHVFLFSYSFRLLCVDLRKIVSIRSGSIGIQTRTWMQRDAILSAVQYHKRTLPRANAHITGVLIDSKTSKCYVTVTSAVMKAMSWSMCAPSFRFN